jgi:hypothetical protein
MKTVLDLLRRLHRTEKLQHMMTITRVGRIYSQMMEHLSDRFTEPTEAINKATYFVAKYYLSAEE